MITGIYEKPTTNILLNGDGPVSSKTRCPLTSALQRCPESYPDQFGQGRAQRAPNWKGEVKLPLFAGRNNLTLYTQILSELISDLDVRAKTGKALEGIYRVTLHGLYLEMERFLRSDTKSMSKKRKSR